MPIDKKAVQDRLKQFDLAGLFTKELGWDWHTQPLQISVKGHPFTIAEAPRAVASSRLPKFSLVNFPSR